MDEILKEKQIKFKNTSKMNEDEIAVFQNYALKKTIILSSALLIGFCVLIGVGLCFIELYFEFFQDYFMVTSEATTSKESNDYSVNAEEKLLYSDLFQVVVYKTYIFLYINKAQSFVLNQKGMTLGTAGELILFLKDKGLKIIDKSSKIDESKIIANKKKA